ncbi:phosphoglucosamine mutase [Verrucomicrobiaceae bacterium N1E253]|uniref:Phosphoglucosamine mutase n=1 Tax=Oceaniferula marina TaxID=2748318 RepID=A0A851GCC7_9BACT|nr:phosphoglucosamine mutase [Oceaniferula marina]NWK55378.1 phosphoglucosamine mutase [Oceaniferula marina]
MNTQLFGTDGIRGIANQWPITPEVALRIGRAVARVLDTNGHRRHKVVIGKDTRLSGYMLETAITSGLVSEGSTVLLTGPAPTPAVAHLTRSMSCDAGIMLTASHNPYQDNGIKIFGPDGYKLSDALELEIEKLILGEELPHPENDLGKAIRIDDAMGRYIEFTKNAVGANSLRGLKIVIDCANGAGYYVGPLIFEELGAEVIKLSTRPDGQNINENCGALHPENAAAAVKQHGAHVGICFDGDADRVIFCDETGSVVDGDRVLCLCAKALHAQGKLRGNTLVATVMSNLGLRDALSQDGITLETTGVGDRLVLERMREKGYNLGGENSGHIIYSDHATTGDGIMSALMLLAMMRESGSALSELADCMDIYPQVLLGLDVQEKPPIESIPEVHKAIQEAETRFADKGRVLVRYSGTERKIRVLTECSDAELAKTQAELIANAIQNTIGA